MPPPALLPLLLPPPLDLDRRKSNGVHSVLLLSIKQPRKCKGKQQDGARRCGGVCGMPSGVRRATDTSCQRGLAGRRAAV